MYFPPKRELIWNFRCYCRKKSLFSFPSVFGSQIQVFISSDIAQQKHNIRPHKTLQSDSTQTLRDRVLLEVSQWLIQMGIDGYFLVLVLVCELSPTARREVKFRLFWELHFLPAAGSTQNPAPGLQNKDLERCDEAELNSKTRKPVLILIFTFTFSSWLSCEMYCCLNTLLFYFPRLLIYAMYTFSLSL